MSVTSISSTSSSSSSSSSVASTALMANYDTFLKLLTTQLQTQNPLEPMDADKFTQQLVQYSAVEQQLQTNSKLDNMLSAMTSNAALQLVNYVGKDVSAYSDTTKMTSGKASWNVEAGGDAKDVTVTITNSAGAVVYTGSTTLKEGDNTYTWDGKGNNGSDFSISSDEFTVSFDAKDADGKAVSTSTEISGKVEGIDTSSSQPYLKINGVLVPLSSLISIGDS